MPKLIIDIETAGEDFESLDETTKSVLTRWIRRESDTEEEYEAALEDLKQGLGFSPLTGEIIALGVLNYEQDRGVIYFQAPGAQIEEFEEKGTRFRPATEKEMLADFWKGAEYYDEFITFNGRRFDIPFLMIRSAVHHLRPTKNLMSHRYLESQKSDQRHIDLQDQLSFYGALRRRGDLHLWSRLFDIPSPKGEGVSGDQIGRLFREKKFLEIARYNAADLRATKALYDYWQKYLKF